MLFCSSVKTDNFDSLLLRTAVSRAVGLASLFLDVLGFGSTLFVMAGAGKDTKGAIPGRGFLSSEPSGAICNPPSGSGTFFFFFSFLPKSCSTSCLAFERFSSVLSYGFCEQQSFGGVGGVYWV